MTFEEFFLRKKIDLKALKAANESLYNEFRIHYDAMGEKSFDHSKKFWFNKLRKSYHLQEEKVIKAEQQSETIVAEIPVPIKDDITAVAKNTAESSTETLSGKKPAGFKPRFKAGVTPTEKPSSPTEQSPKAPELQELPEQKALPEDTTAAQPKSKPTGFKPRFKAGVPPTVKPSSPTEQSPKAPELQELPEQKALPEDTTAAQPKSKPTGFKPRFKAGVTSTVKPSSPTEQSPKAPELQKLPEQKALPEDTTAAQPKSKPTGFKPRFKAGVTPAVKPSPPTEQGPKAPELQELPEQKALPEDTTAAQPQSKPTGFKPRFKAGVPPTVKPSSPTEQSPKAPELQKLPEQKALPEDTAAAQPQSKPTGFKPRFKAGITKNPKQED